MSERFPDGSYTLTTRPDGSPLSTADNMALWREHRDTLRNAALSSAPAYIAWHETSDGDGNVYPRVVGVVIRKGEVVGATVHHGPSVHLATVGGEPCTAWMVRGAAGWEVIEPGCGGVTPETALGYAKGEGEEPRWR